MKQFIQRLSVTGLLISALSISLGGTAFAHIVVRPAEIVTASFQTFTIGVPNEKDIPTTTLKLVIPYGLKYVSPTTKTGWQIAVEKNGNGENATVTSITWSGNTVEQGFRDDFTFSAQVPEKTTELQWKAYQSYSDGTVVSWDKADTSRGHDSEDKSSGPFSVTKVVTETAATASQNKVDQAVANAKTSAERALYVGVAGVVLALSGIFLATRKK